MAQFADLNRESDRKMNRSAIAFLTGTAVAAGIFFSVACASAPEATTEPTTPISTEATEPTPTVEPEPIPTVEVTPVEVQPTPTPIEVEAPDLPTITLIPCPQEDSDNCYWDAARMGNGTGTSFVTINGITYYPSN